MFAETLFRSSLSQWEPEAENGAALAIFCPDVASVTFENRARDSEPQTDPVRLARDEGVEDAGQISVGDAFSGVRYPHFNEVGFRVLAGPDRQVVRFGLVVHGIYAVHHQVNYHLLQMDRIGSYRQRLRRKYGAQYNSPPIYFR